MRGIVLSTLVAAVAVGIGACREAIRIADPPEVLDDRLIVLAALDPDSALHPLLVEAADPRTQLTGTVARLYRADDGSRGVAWALVDTTAQLLDRETCAPRYSTLGGSPECYVLEAILKPGTTYRVEVSSQDRATARGETRVVGPFTVDSAALSDGGESPTLTASWTPSQVAETYLVSVRRYNKRLLGGERGWFTDVAATSISIRVPEGVLDNALRPLTLDVVALDPHLWAYMTTGSGGEGLTIPPLQNVDGGFGVVGSYTLRSRRLATGDGS